ncbi:MAG: AAA family ATPase [Bacilli bacterium]|nr:AAA family ATPase [Bacilli bacterium]
MNFKITKLEIENFRSIQDKVTLNIKSGLFSIEGINYTETNSTNGSGKSTLISALFWALTGSSLTNEVLADEVVNLKTNKNCRVSVYISTNTDEIKVTRVRKDTELGNNLFLEINGQDLSCHKVADTQDRINKLIKIPFSLLRNTIIMTSSMDSAFSSLTPQQRIQTLESIRDYSIWERIRDEANKDIKEYTKQITDNSLEISNLNGKVETYKDLIIKAKQEKENLENTQSIDKIEEEVATVKKAKDDRLVAIREKEAEIVEFKKTSPSSDSSDIAQKMNTIVTEVNDLKAQVTKEKQDIDNNIRDLEYSKKDLQRDINLIERWFKEDTCPTCGRKLDRTETEINDNNNKLAQYNEKLAAITTEITNYISKKENSSLEAEINVKIDNKRQEYSKLQSDLNNIKSIKDAYDRQYDKLQDELRTLQMGYNAFDVELGKLANKKNNYLDRLARYDADIVEYNSKIEENINKVKDLEANNSELGNKKLLSDFYYKLLGAKGELRPYLLSKDIAYLNNRMQFYINRFFKNTEVSLLLNNAAIDIKIQADGVTKSISSLSGGEKKRVDISIQLALYDLIQTVSQSKFNLLCLDEIESLLDPIGCEQLIEIIEDKAENIETVWWITNHPSVKESIAQKILVKKILGKTEVEEL